MAYSMEGDVDMLTKNDLKAVFEDAKQRTIDVLLELTLPDREEPEYIVVLTGNLDYKLGYYLENYNDNLELKHCPAIRIRSAMSIDFVDNVL